MIYDSIDIIPAKLYFKIVETGEISLLSTSKEEVSMIALAWESIELQHSQLEQGKEANKAIDIHKRIEAFSCKWEAIKAAVHCLRRLEDQELTDMLTSYGFVFTDNIVKTLDKIENDAKAIEIRIRTLQNKLPKEKKQKGKTSFDKVVLSYGAITGLGFIDTNSITLTQYYALIDTGNEKIKALESGGKSSSNKR